MFTYTALPQQRPCSEKWYRPARGAVNACRQVVWVVVAAVKVNFDPVVFILNYFESYFDVAVG